MSLNSSKEIIKDFFYLTYIHNEGAAFGILDNNVVFLIGISVIFLIMFIYYIEKNSYNKIQEIAYSFLLGGVVGNLIDRIFRGYVIDFLDFKIFSYDFPIFNIADVAIVIGVCLLIYAIIKGEDYGSSSKRKESYR
jgi:signal peptidase II